MTEPSGGSYTGDEAKGKAYDEYQKLLTVGGDERMLYTSQSLAEKGFDVEIFASSPPAGFENMCPTGRRA